MKENTSLDSNLTTEGMAFRQVSMYSRSRLGRGSRRCPAARSSMQTIYGGQTLRVTVQYNRESMLPPVVPTLLVDLLAGLFTDTLYTK